MASISSSTKIKRVFVSHDFDNDGELPHLLAGQAKHPDTPFVMSNWSLKEPLAGDWKQKIRSRIAACDLVVVLCGKSTHTANGVSVEIEIARELGIPYFLLAGRDGSTKPKAALPTDKMYKWTWDNLKALIGGAR